MGGITHALIGTDWVVRPKRRPPFRPKLAPVAMDARRLGPARLQAAD